MMKSKFELPEAIFNVTKSFPIKADKPVQMASKTLNNASARTTLTYQKILEVAKWTVLIAIVTIIISMTY